MFIEVSEGFSVKIDEIEAVVRVTDLTSRVLTKNNSYDSTFPYEVLIELINRYGEKETEIEKKEFNILKEIGSFAG